jgi:sugar phosphate isomerase/epimerase
LAVIGGRAHNLELVHEVGRLGYPFAEISVYDPEEMHRAVGEFLELKKKYGIYYLAHYPNEGNPFDADALKKVFVPRMVKLFEVTRELGIEKGTLHFWMDRRWAEPGLLAAKRALLAEMVAAAGDKGITLCIENLTERYESFAEICDAIPRLRMTLDIGHGELLSSENTSFGFIRHLFDRIAHLHVHDNHGGTSVKDDLHLPLGQGRVDYPRIFSILKEKGYRHTVTMELKPAEMPPTKRLIEEYLF